MSWTLVREPGMVRVHAPDHPRLPTELAQWLTAQIGRLDLDGEGVSLGRQGDDWVTLAGEGARVELTAGGPSAEVLCDAAVVRLVALLVGG